MSDPAPPSIDTDPTLPSEVTTWPYLVRIEMLVALVAIVVLVVWSITIDAPLEGPANANLTPDPSKAPWYFLGLQEILVYFDPWIAGVAIPGLIILGLIAIPYIDPNPEGNGYYTLRERPFAVGTFLFGFLALWVVPIFVGVFCRGPGWNWYWPWESWDIEKTHDMTTRNLTDLVGLGDGGLAMFAGGLCVLAWYGLGWLAWLKRERMAPLRQLDGLRFSIVAFLFLSMAAIPLKIALRLALDIKYVCVTPWFNI